MKFFLIYFLDCKTYKTVTLKGQYNSNEDASEDLLNVALDYVRTEQGKRQAEIALQDKSSEEMLNDETLKEGFYLRRDETVIRLYEKAKETVSGYLYNTYNMNVKLVGSFGVTEVVLDLPSKNIDVVVASRKPKKSTQSLVYMQELMDRLKSGSNNFGLKPVPVEYVESDSDSDSDFEVNFE